MMIEATSSIGRRFSPSAVLQVNCPSRQLRDACGESMVTMWKLTKKIRNASVLRHEAFGKPEEFRAGVGEPFYAATVEDFHNDAVKGARLWQDRSRSNVSASVSSCWRVSSHSAATTP